jgi:hypothetical protein
MRAAMAAGSKSDSALGHGDEGVPGVPRTSVEEGESVQQLQHVTQC